MPAVEWMEAFEKGRKEVHQEMLQEFRAALLRCLESRFDSLLEELRLRIEGIDSIEELAELSLRAGAASSVTALEFR